MEQNVKSNRGFHVPKNSICCYELLVLTYTDKHIFIIHLCFAVVRTLKFLRPVGIKQKHSVSN